MKSKSVICICAIFFVIIMVSGCGKDYFFEYNCNWQCDDPYAITRTIPTSVKDGKLHISNLIKKGDEYVLSQVN